jgi:hypothetical protein
MSAFEDSHREAVSLLSAPMLPAALRSIAVIATVAPIPQKRTSLVQKQQAALRQEADIGA